jgi:HlyD family secretion protein
MHARPSRAPLLLTTLALTLGLLAALGFFARVRAPRSAPHFATILPETADIQPRLLVSGDVEGGERTLITCELEDLLANDPDPSDASGLGGQTVLEVVPDGARVKKGDLLVRFDSSRYEERARRLRIDLERARADERQADLQHGAADAALAAYRDGEARQTAESLRAEQALAQADLLHAQERLAWVQQMRTLNYASADDLAQAHTNHQRLEIAVQKVATALKNHVDLSAPKKIRELQIAVENAADDLRFSTDQRLAIESRLKSVTDQLAKCTIRAPHDGMAVLIDWWWQRDGADHRVAPGTRVTQHEELMYLPDMDHLEIEIPLHESLIRHVRKDLPAEVHLPAFPNRTFTGRVSQVHLLPTEQWRAYIEYQGFVCRIKLDTPPPGLRPGMSAQVNILTEPHHQSLLIPAGCVAYDDQGQPFCYVLNPATGQPTRHLLTLAQGDYARLAVVSGLTPTDRVLLDPADVHGWAHHNLQGIKGDPAPLALTARR